MLLMLASERVLEVVFRKTSLYYLFEFKFEIFITNTQTLGTTSMASYKLGFLDLVEVKNK